MGGKHCREVGREARSRVDAHGDAGWRVHVRQACRETSHERFAQGWMDAEAFGRGACETLGSERIRVMGDIRFTPWLMGHALADGCFCARPVRSSHSYERAGTIEAVAGLGRAQWHWDKRGEENGENCVKVLFTDHSTPRNRKQDKGRTA